ncbi:AMP-binding protein, partial [Lysinibacillus xylanilyticus]|uniref:AMP-binding protein n=1 Tax=Lysinibacillus xylanilyticus TaxID=582475 RepID=UPI00382C160E
KSKVELIITAGSEAKKSMVAELSKKCRYINAYGPTEYTICTTIWEYENKDYNLIPIGKPISNTKVYIVDQHNNLVPIGVIGELCISGDGIARGYLDNKELTEQKFIENPYELEKRMYKTGDLARWLPDGNIEFLGRIDHQVKIRGFRIELAEIENKLLQIDGVKDVIVIDKEDVESKYLCAYYVSEKEHKVSELREELEKYLPDYMIPSYFVRLSEIPLTTNGKIEKNALPVPSSEFITGEVFEDPRNEIEQIIVEVWSQVLGLNKISINDNFFSLGGNSLNAIKIVSILVDKNINITLSDIFMYQNIKSICNNYTVQNYANCQSDKVEIDEKLNNEVDLKEFLDLTRDHINKEYKEFIKTIISRKVINKYKLSEIQKMTKELGMTKSGTKIDLNFEVDIMRLKSAVSSLINQQEMLRTAIVEKGSEMYLYEHDKIDNINLPFIDLSKIEKDQRISSLKELISDITYKVLEIGNYTKNRIYFAFILIKNETDKFVLYMIANHLIFDGMSAEVVKNLILKEYMNNGHDIKPIDTKLTYFDYINQIKNGPRDITEEEIINVFKLNHFMEVLSIYNEKLTKIKHKLVVKKIEFELPPEILNNQNQIWEFAFQKFTDIYRNDLDIEKLPVHILNMGRRLGGKNYYTVVGEFLDIIPYISGEYESNLKDIDALINFASEKNINFTTILEDKELSKKYEKIGRILNQFKHSYSNIPIFNYLGVYDIDYSIAHLYELKEELKHNTNSRLQRGANCYIRGNKLIMFIDVIENNIK